MRLQILGTVMFLLNRGVLLMERGDAMVHEELRWLEEASGDRLVYSLRARGLQKLGDDLSRSKGQS